MLESKKVTDISAIDTIEDGKIVAVLVIDDSDSAIPVAEALLQGGVKAIELTLRTPQALDAMKKIKSNLPEMVVGAGTVLTTEQLKKAKEAGADFAVAPGLNCNVVEKSMDLDLLFMPGICTPSEIEKAVELGCYMLKFFPAEPSGGVKYLKSVAAPYNHLGLKYMPLGGLSENNFMSYFSLPNVFAVGGSWIATRDVIENNDWQQIESRARTACDMFNKVAV